MSDVLSVVTLKKSSWALLMPTPTVVCVKAMRLGRYFVGLDALAEPLAFGLILVQDLTNGAEQGGRGVGLLEEGAPASDGGLGDGR